MRILITGHNGFIGGHLYRRLEQTQKHSNDFLVEGIDRPNDVCDLNDIIGSLSLNETDVVVHCAALTSVTESEGYQRTYAGVNIIGTVNMLRLFPKAKFIFLSTSAVYGEGVMHTEDGPTKPKSFYAVTKLGAERCIEHMSQNYAILRLANVIGEGSKDNVYKRFANEDPITIYGNGHQTRDFIHVDDVVRAIIRAFDNSVQGTYNIGSGKNIRILDLARTFNKKIDWKEARPGEIREISMDLTKATRANLIT